MDLAEAQCQAKTVGFAEIEIVKPKATGRDNQPVESFRAEAFPNLGFGV